MSYQVSFSTQATLSETLADTYLDLGAQSVFIEVQVGDPSLHQLTVMAATKAWFKSAGILAVPVRLQKSQWEYQHEQSVVTQELISGVRVRSVHAASDDGELPVPYEILLDLRGAFGDGAHPTTQLCAQFLKELMETHRIDSVVDMGTGTGVLAILASKLGAELVHAFDFDPVAVKRTRRNVRLNMSAIKVWQGDVLLDIPAQSYTCVLANLHSELLSQSMAKLSAWVAEGSFLIVSGVYHQWRDEILGRLTSEGFLLVEERPLTEWTGFLLQKPV